MNIVIKPSSRKDKKFEALIDGKKTIHFGQAGASDFTQHKNEARKKLYENRHRKNEQWNNPLTAGFWSKNILWNKKTLSESIKDTNNKYNVNIKMR